MTYLEGIADGMARNVLADPINLDDSTLVDLMAAAMGASSVTLQEAFLTSIRIRRAELRAIAILDKHNQKAG